MKYDDFRAPKERTGLVAIIVFFLLINSQNVPILLRDMQAISLEKPKHTVHFLLAFVGIDLV